MSTEELIEIIAGIYAAWGAGTFNGPDAKEELLKVMHADTVSDASADLKNTDGYRVYNGIEDHLKLFEFLAGMDFAEFTPELYGGGEGKLICRHTYGVTNKATGKSMEGKNTDIVEVTFVDGKVKHYKYYWGNPAAMDAIFA
jgi:ketosteroid isomerase-like protein